MAWWIADPALISCRLVVLSLRESFELIQIGLSKCFVKIGESFALRRTFFNFFCFFLLRHQGGACASCFNVLVHLYIPMYVRLYA